ncbi:LamG-like jellyroll fold domain-containing protein [Fluviicola chungangensis]|uniref:Laminin G domain-containing protein n=1 Tax=Fluviicola chungangensis TaxID=2597671 RepID=A0A556N2Y9_9FLAO|nr:LamG-like jellyroll fold domain-containing protein [Fluviicola chungangensis]TSJ46564.1 hypothetical protein FO442_05235 [Fluviicola chungangensis]
MSQRILFVFLCMILTAGKLHAVVQPYSQGVLMTPTISSPPIVKNDPSSFITSYLTPTGISLTPYDLSRKAMLTFGVNHHYETYFDEATIEITLDIDLYLNGSLVTPLSGVIMEIKNQSTGTLTFGDKQILTYDGYDKIEASITEIKVNGVAQNNLPANLFLQADVFVDRIYEFASQTSIVPVFPGDALAEDLDCDEIPDQLLISWDEIEGAEEYQLEWFHINDIDIASTTDLDINFKTNSTRITTKYTYYDLSLIFDQGYICYRVRGVGRSADPLTADRLLFTNWSTPDGEMTVDDLPAYSSFYVDDELAFDIHKNWQYSSTYAEEGKRKEVISFFDGSLRNRQMVTKINSKYNHNNNAIVGETIYDYQGRPAIQVLPVPVKSPEECEIPNVQSTLRYYPDFNLNDEGTPAAYSKDDFDKDNTAPESACSTILRGMSDIDGASRYYSTANNDLAGSQAFIPDAQNFPFSQVEYTPDNTGRIRRQGGVGEEFQLGSDHETKYFYGHPLQDQLDRLFGSEVGDAAHYQKNMVVDPNGQVSVSYLDQEGRVIATSLAGEVPTTMMDLPSASGGTTALSSDLFATDENGNTTSTANKLSINGRSKLFNQVVTISSETDLTIHYGLEIDAFEDECLAENICFSCVYDLEIEVRNQCGELLSPSEYSNKKTGRFELVGSTVVFKTDCEDFEADEISFTISHDLIPVGTYQITKKLTVNEEAIQAYLDMYLNPTVNTCRTTLDEFVEIEEENSDIDDCSDDFSCDECVTNLGTLLAYIEAGGTEDEYYAELEVCKAPCKSDSYYEIMREVLKADVMPGGQYGEYTNNQGVVSPGSYQLSVFNTGNQLPIANADWKHPKYDVEASIQDFYFDEDGTTRSRIYLEDVVINGSNQITSSDPLMDDATADIGTQAFYDAATNNYYTYPQNLLKLEDFITYYGQNPYWANSLVVYHPEYPILKIYRTYYEPVNPGDAYTSESYDAKLMSVNTWEGAMTAGLINSGYTGLPVNDRFNYPLAVSMTNPWDPYGTYVDHVRLQNKVYAYMTIGSTTYSMMEIAAMMTRCQTATVGNAPEPECTLWGADIPGYTTIQNEQTRDAEWLIFRGMYIAAKQELQHERAIYLSINDANYYGYNGCIGNDNFHPFDNGFLHPYPSPPWINGEFFNTDQPCYILTMALYQNKDVRFGSAYDYVNNDPANVAYQQYLMTGKCPIASSFEQLLAQVADMDLLDSPGFAMDVLPSLSGLVMTMNNFAAPISPIPSFMWVPTTIGPYMLEIAWEEGGLPVETFSLQKATTSFDWGDIISFNNILYTSHVGSLYEFTIKALVNVGGVVEVHNLTGSTTLQVGGCSFVETCELNELGKDLELMMQVLTTANEFASTSPVSLTSAPYDDFLTTAISYTVSPTPSVPKWTHSLAIPGFEIADGSDVLKITINDFTPSTFSLAALNTVASISEVRAGYNNTFEIVCLDGSGNHLVTLQCDLIRNNVTPISMGECDLPTPIQCEGPEFANFRDLEEVLKSVLTTQDAPFNLVTTGLWTSNLNSSVPAGTTSISGTITSNLDGDQFLTFDMPNGCDLVLTYDHSQGTGFDFDAITSVDAMDLVDPVNNYNSYYDFELQVSYLDGGVTETAILTGTSCFKLMKCTDCNDYVSSDPSVTPITFGSNFPSDNGPIPTLDEEPENTEILCQDLYEDYVTAYQNFIAVQIVTPTCPNYDANYPMLTYQEFLDHNYCCLPGSNNMLNFVVAIRNFVGSGYTTCPPNTVYGEGTSCNTRYNCPDIWAQYELTVTAFNESHWAGNNHVDFGDSVMLKEDSENSELYCDCVAEYSLYLLEYITAALDEQLPAPMSSVEFCASQPIREPKSDCEARYLEYVDFMTSYNEVMSNTHGDELGIVESDTYTENNLCYCLDEYLSLLNMNLDGLIADPNFSDLGKFCSGRTVSTPCLLDTATTNFETFEFTYDDPCQEFYQSNIDINAQMAYEQHTQQLQSEFIDRYIKHCMSAVEYMNMGYEELEHHFTLYYYDQAGNLVKTVPPEGVSFIDLSVSGVKTAIANDRKFGTHKITTDHHLETTYLYNSLNQLVSQRMPDQDAMQILEPVMPNGLPVGFITTGIQMISSNQGYATGYMTVSGIPTGTRGYLFKTMNGGQNWTRVNNTLAANFKEVKMVSATQGFAIGQQGLFFVTNDGAVSWDLVSTYGLTTPITADFVAMDVKSGYLYLLTKTGDLYKYQIGAGYSTVIALQVAAPTNPSGYTVVEFKDFILPTTILANNSGIIYVATVTNGETYDAILLRNTTASYTVENVRVAHLETASFYNGTDGVVAGVDGNISKLNGPAGNYVQSLHTSDAAGTIAQLVMLDANRGVARIIENGVGIIRTTTDGGTTWEQLETGFPDANLSLNKRTSTTIEVLIQGFELVGSVTNAYSKTVLMNTANVISVLDQTPNLQQDLELKVITTYVDGSNTYYFGISSDNKLYRSNGFTTIGSTVNYVEITNAATLPVGIVPKQIVCVKNGSGISVYILSTTGTVYRTASTAVTNDAGYTTLFTGANMSTATSVRAIDQLVIGGSNYLIAYNLSDNSLYHALSSGSSFTVFTTSLSLGTSAISNLAVHGNQVTLIGTNGGIFTCGAISSTGTSLTFTARESHRLPKLTGAKLLTAEMALYGENGLVLTRAISSSATTCVVKPLGTVNQINSISEFTESSVTYYVFAGGNGYLKGFNSSSWAAQPEYYTSTGALISDHSNNIALTDIAMSGTAAYVVGEQGRVYYTPNITTDHFMPAAATITATNLRSVSINNAANRCVVAGENTYMARFVSNLGTTQNQIFGPAYRDVHFADAQTGTIIGDHYLVRSTTTSDASWKVCLPASIAPADMNNLRKVWTIKTTGANPYMLIGGVNYFAQVSDQVITVESSFSGTVTDIQFEASSPYAGYYSVGTGLHHLSVTMGTYPYSYSSLTTAFANAPLAINAIHVFDNDGIAIAAINGISYYYRPSTNAITSLYTTGGSPANTCRDIYFHDHVSGVIVGNNGALSIITASIDPLSKEIVSSTGQGGILTDPTGTANTNYDITCIAFGSRNTAVYGGSYTSGSGLITTAPAMVRYLKVESGLYSSRFFYDRLGRIVVSQNSRQLGDPSIMDDNEYSYTLYDPLGRVNEAGGKFENFTSNNFQNIFGAYVGGSFVPTVVNDQKMADWLAEDTYKRFEVTKSYYDNTNVDISMEVTELASLNTATQRKRIVHVTYSDTYSEDANEYDHATHYDYDIHGNVKTLYQDNRRIKDIVGVSQHRLKKMDYVYDLISGNVHRVDYQTGMIDQWHHAYEYDADNRIVNAYTTKSTPLTSTLSSSASLQNEPGINPQWEKEVEYNYYQHGPLARTVLGEQQVQGLDYVYTLQGWIKAVNSNTLDATRDPGEDGGFANHVVPKDAYGYSLHYFEGDYTGAGGNNAFAADQSSSDLVAGSEDLYNGNIGRMVTTITHPDTRVVLPLGNAYRYDQLNRLREATSFNNLDLGTNSWSSGGFVMYRNSFEYDANGNITYQRRQDEAGNDIDMLTYNYHKDGLNQVLSNRLYSVTEDGSISSGTYSDDIDDMLPFDASDAGINVNNNYQYDKEGRLIVDIQEELYITWRLSGKPWIIYNTTGSPTKKSVSFDYDAMGHRIAKHIYASDLGYQLIKSIYYILDAQGNVMSVYEHEISDAQETVSYNQTEKHIYGSSRLGMHSEEVPVLASQYTTYDMGDVTHRIGYRNYELTNHLGNVLSVVSDRIVLEEDPGAPAPENSVYFDGVNDYGVTSGFAAGLSTALSMECWVKTTTSGSTQILGAYYNGGAGIDKGAVLILTSAGKVSIDGRNGTGVYRSSGVSSASVNDGNWHHVAGTISGGNWKIYVDGVLENSATVTSGTFSGMNEPFYLGRSMYGSYFQGNLREMSLWNYEKTSTQVASDMSTIFTGSETGLVGYWPMTNASVPGNDVSTANHDATMSGGATPATDPVPVIFLADIRQSTDYSPFGVQLHNRDLELTPASGSITPYRYGFQNQEMDDEIKGAGNSLNYEFRMHDPRIGRFFAIDPLASKYPHNSVYAFSENVVIDHVELEGLEKAKPFNPATGKGGEADLNPPSQGTTMTGSNQGTVMLANHKKIAKSTIQPASKLPPTQPSDNLVKKPAPGLPPKQDVIPYGEPVPLPLGKAEGMKRLEGWDRLEGALMGSDGYRQKTIFYENSDGSVSDVTYPVDIDGNYAIPPVTGTPPNIGMGAIGAIGKAKGILTADELLRIENAATRINQPITVVGSRASGTAGAYSDWDYVIPGLNSRNWSKIKNSLPGSSSVLNNTPRNIDVFKGTVNTNLPHITIHPR